MRDFCLLIFLSPAVISELQREFLKNNDLTIQQHSELASAYWKILEGHQEKLCTIQDSLEQRVILKNMEKIYARFKDLVNELFLPAAEKARDGMTSPHEMDVSSNFRHKIIRCHTKYASCHTSVICL